MAEFIPNPPQVVLSPDERRQLVGRLEEHVQAWAERRFALLPPEPGRSEPPPPKRRSKRTHSGYREGKSGHRGDKLPGRMIVGPTPGFVPEDPPFDDSELNFFTQGDLICNPYAGQLPTGQMLVQLYTGQGPQIDGWANAALITMAKPSAHGTMQFYPGSYTLTQSLRGITLGGASAAGAMHIRTGISVITLNPFNAAPISDIADIFQPIEFQLGQNSCYPGPNTWNVNQSQLSSAQPYPSGSSYVANPPNLYACFTWVTASVSTRGDAGVWIDVSLDVPSFQFWVP